MELEDLAARLDNVKRLPSGYSAKCPAHDDKVSSLMFDHGDQGGLVVHCHAGCTAASIMSALELSTKDLMGAPVCTAVYRYLRTDGTLAYEVERWANPKTFRCRPGLPPPAERILYQAPALEVARDRGLPVYVVEGEKDADRLVAEGYVATTNVTGAGAWLPHYGQALKGCHVIVVADNDDTGKAHARTVATMTRPYALSLDLVIPRHGKDVSDLLAAGWSLDDLDPLPDTEDVPSYVAARVRTRRVVWAWDRYIPRGKLTIIEGDPGDGKSILTVDLAARWSTGAPMPDGSNGAGPWAVAMVSAEDDMADTIVPRLMAAGARLEAIHLLPHGATPERPWTFTHDLEALERLVVAEGIGAVIWDPLTAFLAASTDTHNDAEVRRALYPLAAFAARTNVAGVAVRHLNKGGQGVKAVYRGNGSIAFTGAARAGFLVAQDPQDAEVKILACVKTNLARRPASLRYRLVATAEDVPRVEWLGTVDLSAQDALDGPPRQSLYVDELESKRRARTYEIQFLQDVLAEGPMAWKEIVDIGKQDGFTEISLRRARADAGLMKVFEAGGNAGTRWALPSTGDSPHLLTCSPDGGLKPRDTNEGASEQVPAPSHEDGTSDDDLDAQLEALPLVCSICKTTDAVMRFAGPWWVVRCVDHNPREYEAGI